jgi:Secretion system C-terminal sorting domain
MKQSLHFWKISFPSLSALPVGLFAFDGNVKTRVIDKKSVFTFKPISMNTTVPFGWLKLTIILTAFLQGFTGFAQTVPELIFKNPVLISGTAGQNGAKYRFSNVSTGALPLDVILEIKGRSASDVILKSIDSTGIGWDKAFQPILGIPNVGANREWWMEFEMQFVDAGTSNQKIIDTFFVTGLDIDGDNNHLNEWSEMKKAKQMQVAAVSSLSCTLLSSVIDLVDCDNNGNDYRINGPVTNYGNIDTGATVIMATYKYAKKSKISFKIGGKTNASGGSSGEATMRMNSLWFRQFSLIPVTLVTLPLNLIDFNAVLNKSKVDLKWITTSEKNVNHFEVERSADGINYSEAALVFAYGNTTENKTYTFANDISNLQNGVLYYRLRSVDDDGKSSLSGVRIIRIGKQSELLSMVVYPNPVSSELRLTLPASWQTKEVTLEVFNQSGQRAKALKSGNANQTETIIVNELAKGFYLVKASCGTETVQQKFIKN